MALYTKKLIMTTFQEMLAEMPFDRITVSALVKRAGGSPNTFYYHYQDIYSVLEWIVVREICTPLRYDESVSAEDWCMQALTLLRARQPLLRRISPALGREKLYQLTAGILRPQLARFLPAPDTQDAGTYRLALDMLCYAAFCTLDSLVVSRPPLNVETCARNMRALFVTMRQAS